jgi:hypothetical protein
VARIPWRTDAQYSERRARNELLTTLGLVGESHL